MLTLLLGDFGAGKTTRIHDLLRQDTAEKRPCRLLVPEQQTVLAENALYTALPPDAPLYLEVTNFSRLANTAFRMAGGLSTRTADASVRALCMWRALRELGPTVGLSSPRGEDVALYLSAVDQLRAAAIPPEALARAAEELGQQDRLGNRMRTLAAVSAAFSAVLGEKYDDVAEEPDRLVQKLEERPLFAGVRFYADSFTSFTEQEYRVLFQLMKTCDLTVSLCLPPDKTGLVCYEEPEKAMHRLTRLANEAGVPVRVERLCGTPDTPPMLRFAADLLRGNLPLTYTGEEDGSLSLVLAPDPFEEADCLAADILRRVQTEGLRYRDIAVLAGNARDYAGILDGALEKAGIPCFFSVPTDLAAFEPVKLIHAAYAILRRAFRREDVICLLKCGFYPLTREEQDAYEIYTETWNLSGAALSRPGDWDMNPDGYADHVTDSGRALLERANQAKAVLLPPLLAFCQGAKQAGTVDDHIRVLYRYLTALSVPQALVRRAGEEESAGRLTQADRYRRLWDILMGAFDRLHEALGEVSAGSEDFEKLLTLLFAHTDIGSIPPALDGVTVGSADLLRTEGRRVVYLFGVNDGEFPAPVRDDGFFSEGDRQTLQTLGVEMEPDLLLRASRSAFCFLRALLCAREKAVLLCAATGCDLAAARPAEPLLRLLAAFDGKLSLQQTEALQPEERFFDPQDAADHLGALLHTPAGRALALVLGERAEYAAVPLRAGLSLTAGDCTLSPQTVQALYGSELRLSQSLMDRYRNCPFSFFCQTGLSLREETPVAFAGNTIGNYIHCILERFFTRLSEDGLDPGALEEAQLIRYTALCTRDAQQTFFPSLTLQDPRSRHVLSRLGRLATLLIRDLAAEFRQSRFRPMGQEVKIGREGGPRKMVFTLQDGSTVSFGGIIDRVDAFSSGDNLYLRVVDYKTGTKDFRLSDIAQGKNLQMLLYLTALWQDPGAPALSGQPGTPVPAGVEYLSVGGKDPTSDTPLTEEEADALCLQSLTRSGVLLEEEEVQRAASADLAPHFLPAKAKGKEKNTLSLQEFGDLLLCAGDRVAEVGGAIRSGDARAIPQEKNAKEPYCRYCSAYYICRRRRDL